MHPNAFFFGPRISQNQRWPVLTALPRPLAGSGEGGGSRESDTGKEEEKKREAERRRGTDKLTSGSQGDRRSC